MVFIGVLFKERLSVVGKQTGVIDFNGAVFFSDASAELPANL